MGTAVSTGAIDIGSTVSTSGLCDYENPLVNSSSILYSIIFYISFLTEAILGQSAILTFCILTYCYMLQVAKTLLHYY